MVLHKPATVRRRQGLDSTGMTGSRKLYVKSFGCQMNVYDSQRMADTLAPEGYVETGTPDDADLIILNTCHIREKAAEKVYSELGRMRGLKEAAARRGPRRSHRRRRLRRAGRGRGNHPPRAGRRSRGRPAELSPSARSACARRARRQGGRHRISARRQIRSSRRAERHGDARARRIGLRHRAGRLRQILHVLRRALYARRRNLATGAENRRRSGAARRCRRARNHADRPERQRLSRRRTGSAGPGRWRGSCERLADAGIAAAALHHQPSARHERRSESPRIAICRR